jgi:hypothetical protein
MTFFVLKSDTVKGWARRLFACKSLPALTDRRPEGRYWGWAPLQIFDRRYLGQSWSQWLAASAPLLVYPDCPWMRYLLCARAAGPCAPRLAEAMGMQIAVERGKSDRWKALHSTHYHAWETPPELWKSVLDRLQIDQFDLDPCSPRDDGPVPARTHLTELDDGLAQAWQGIVWVNPPYGSITIWIDKMVSEAAHGVLIVALVPARTGARWWHKAIESGAKPQFLQGRIRFWRDGKPGDAAPFDSALLWWN